MTTERNISLRMDVGQQALSDSTAQHHPDTPRQATPQDRDAFLRALHTASGHPDIQGQRQHPDTNNAARDHPLSHSIPSVAVPPAPTVNRLETPIQHDLCESLERLLVSDEGNHEEVRLDIKDDALPGVSIRLFEAEGRLTVCFVCSADAVRRRLDATITELAGQLATRLQRDVLVQVQTDDPQDLRLNEALARPQG